MFHRHKWKVVAQQAVEVYSAYADSEGVPIGHKTYLALRCDECGMVKGKTIKGSFKKVLGKA